MSQDQNMPNVSAASEAEARMAPSLSFEDACALLKRQGRLISADDIELVVLVALNNEFMRLQFETSDEQLQRHNRAITQIMSSSVKSMKAAMAEEKAAFASAVRSVALENVTVLISQHQKDMAIHAETIRQASRLALGALGVASVVIVMAFVMAGKLL